MEDINYQFVTFLQKCIYNIFLKLLSTPESATQNQTAVWRNCNSTYINTSPCTMCSRVESEHMYVITWARTWCVFTASRHNKWLNL